MLLFQALPRRDVAPNTNRLVRMRPSRRRTLARTMWLGAAACAANAAAQEQAVLATEIWHPRTESGACAGVYLDAPGQVGATGLVRMREGERWLTSHAAEVNDAGVALVEGVFDYGEEGLRLRAADATVDLQSGDVRARDVDWVLTALSLRGQAAQIHKEGDQVRLADAALTPCSPDSSLWHLRAGEVELDAGNSAVKARHVRVHLAAVPVFYVPYAHFGADNERASGFLFPELRHERESGVDVTLPYYLNLAPNYDATIAARHVQERGTGVEAEFRHLGRSGRDSLQAAILPGDRIYNGALARDDYLAQGGDPAAFADANRWLWSVQHRGRRGAWTTDVDFAAVSDADYFRDFDSNLDSTSQVALRQRAVVRYQRGELRARVAAEGLQRLRPGITPYRRLPDAAVSVGGSLGVLDWTLDSAWTAFRLPGGESGVAAGRPGRVEGDRLHLEPRLRLPLLRDWGFLAMTVGARHTRYTLEGNGDAPAEPSRNIQFASIDGGLRFERDLRAGRWLQTLEPRLRLFHQSHAEQDHLPLFDAAPLTLSYDQLFRDNRFAGVDRIGEADQVSLGVTSRIIDERGRERLSARFGALTRLRDAKVTLPNHDAAPNSALAADLGTEFGAMRLRTTVAWDAERDALRETGVAVAYRKDAERLVNLGYRRRMDADIEQTDVSFHWAFSPRWRLFGRWNHDWRSERMVEGFAGFGYANCCLEVNLLGHKTIEPSVAGLAAGPEADRGVLVEVVLRGLGGVGGGVDARLARAIRGLRP